MPSTTNNNIKVINTDGYFLPLGKVAPRWNKRGGLTQPSVFVFKRPVTSLGWQTPPLALGYLLLLVIFGWFSY